MGRIRLLAVPRLAGRYIFIIGVAAAFFVSCGSANQPANSNQTTGSTSSNGFVVFDGTMYRNKPDLSKHRIQPINIVYSGRFWDDKSRMSDLPAEQTVRQLAREAADRGDITVVDIEHWPLSGNKHETRESLQKYLQVLKWFRNEAPALKIGYYGMPPIRDYWRTVKGAAHTEYIAWQAENRELAPLSAEIDAVFPSLYTFYTDQAGWTKYAVAQINEARRYGKPVYVFLWPQYHDSNPSLGGKFVPSSFWRLQLETALAHADGMIIWGGWTDNGPAEWDESAPWWQETKRFLNQLP